MTKEQAQAKSQEKSKAVQVLCNQLQITITAEQMITENGLIKNVVYYTDNEKYDIDEEKKVEPKKSKKSNHKE